jgi:hypothetical protein
MRHDIEGRGTVSEAFPHVILQVRAVRVDRAFPARHPAGAGRPLLLLTLLLLLLLLLLLVVHRWRAPCPAPVLLPPPPPALQNFKTPLGSRLANVLKHLFPVPKEDSQRVVTFSNDADFISFRHHTFEKAEGATDEPRPKGAPCARGQTAAAAARDGVACRYGCCAGRIPPRPSSPLQTSC